MRIPPTVLGLVTSAAMSGGCAKAPPPPRHWPTRSVAIENGLDEPICMVTLGVDEPAPVTGPVVDYLDAPLADPETVSLARRVSAHGTGVLRLPRPPQKNRVSRYELAVFGCSHDAGAGALVMRIPNVDPDVPIVRVEREAAVTTR